MRIFSQNQDEQQARPQRRGGCFRRLLLFFVIYLLFCGLFGAWLGNSFSAKTVELKPQTVYRIDMDGLLVEQGQAANPFMEMLQSMPGYSGEDGQVGLDQLLSNIALAKADDRIIGIYLSGGEMQMDPASAKALRDALRDFKKSGKWVLACADHYQETNYYVASVADRVCVDPVGAVDWHGLLAQKTYFTRLLEKIGVEMQILKVGTFKAAVEPFFRTSMSDADRAQTRRLLDCIWDEYVSAVSASRGISVEKLNEYADQFMGLQPVELSLQYGLVDTIVYKQDADSLVRTYAGTPDYHVLNTEDLYLVERPESSSAAKLAVVYLSGEITDDDGDGIVGTDVVKMLNKIRRDEDIRAVVLRVNSPGGSADASEHIWHATQMIREAGKPVVVSMGDYAASGGYYISCGADYIVAEPTTLTGSIGIFGTVPNVSKLRENIGVDVDGMGTHRHSELETNMLLHGMNPDEMQLMQTMVERGYDLFTRRCAEGRGMTQDEIKEIAEGRVWTGVDALKIGLVDSLGNINDAIARAVDLGALSQYQVVYYPEVKDPIEELLKALDNTSEEEELIMKVKSFASRPRVMARMPELKIR